MNKILLDHNLYNKNVNLKNFIIPIPDKNGSSQLLLLIKNFLDNAEINQLQLFCDKFLLEIDEKRRKKFVQIKDKLAVSKILGRFIFSSFYFDNDYYEFLDYCENIEIIEWQEEKPLKDVSYDRLTNNKYNDPKYINFVFSIDNLDNKTFIINRFSDERKMVCISAKEGFLWNNKINELIEITGGKRTQIYMHCEFVQALKRNDENNENNEN